MIRSKRATSGAQAGRLLLAAGAFTLINNYLPGAAHLDILVLDLVAGVAIVLGGIGLVLPWDRLHVRAPLVLALAAFALISLGNEYGGVSDFSYAVYFVVVFVWIGIGQPRHTSYWMAPFAIAAYLLPFLGDPDAPANAISSVTVAIPVCVLVGEVLAAQVYRLHDSEHQLRERLDVLSEGVLVLDAQGSTIACNKAAATLLGRSDADLIGSPAPVQLAPAGQPLEQEVVPGRWIEATAVPLPRDGERVVALHDTSRQRALDEAKDLFLATSSHELRTPLTAIKGYVTLLTRRWDALADTTRREALETVDRQTDALIDLTEHLLMGARAGSPVHTPDPTPFDLGEVVRVAVAAYGRLSERHQVVADVTGSLPCAFGQPRSTENVLGQLIENAVKYSPAGGEVTVSVRPQGPLLSVEVADRGIGVPAGLEASIFTPFYQGGPANTREYGGVGLGLYIVRQLVQAQGGTVSAANREGGGAVVRFTVPVHTA